MLKDLSQGSFNRIAAILQGSVYSRNLQEFDPTILPKGITDYVYIDDWNLGGTHYEHLTSRYSPALSVPGINLHSLLFAKSLSFIHNENFRPPNGIDFYAQTLNNFEPSEHLLDLIDIDGHSSVFLFCKDFQKKGFVFTPDNINTIYERIIRDISPVADISNKYLWPIVYTPDRNLDSIATVY